MSSVGPGRQHEPKEVIHEVIHHHVTHPEYPSGEMRALLSDSESDSDDDEKKPKSKSKKSV